MTDVTQPSVRARKSGRLNAWHLLTAFLHGKEGLVERVVAAIGAENLAITVITVQEQIDGRYAFLKHAGTDVQLAYAYQNLTDAVRALSGLHIVTFSEAAIALEEGATVITRNLRDFGRVPGLACENWAD